MSGHCPDCGNTLCVCPALDPFAHEPPAKVAPSPERVERLAQVIAAAFCDVSIETVQKQWGQCPDGRASRAFEGRMRRIAIAVVAEWEMER